MPEQYCHNYILHFFLNMQTCHTIKLIPLQTLLYFLSLPAWKEKAHKKFKNKSQKVR
ncbi:hypothetical protein HMPREF0080_02074 [Anaeroglobus geminatus F0357]|uniref:Uncharacterized protein n=1 Tax=Anaeroglobus geminatus F0357 TaxID=861450 RepID=G9YK65_9FIRM|nr:hypothetical protein HMPREF0080_02074 [Anaeroglobus geminatus F0357]